MGRERVRRLKINIFHEGIYVFLLPETVKKTRQN
jgi:hypothetical protein